MLEAAMFIGLGLVAVWAYVRYPRLRPRSLTLAMGHVVVSFAGFALLPTLLSLVLPLVPHLATRLYIVVLLLIPTVTYVLLSWLWLVGRILQDIDGNPRGGHPASTES